MEWLTVVLAEEALGGPAALQPTPLQRVAGAPAARRACAAPSGSPAAAGNGQAADAAKAIKQLKTAHDINVIIRYEETHKNRSDVARTHGAGPGPAKRDAAGALVSAWRYTARPRAA